MGLLVLAAGPAPFAFRDIAETSGVHFTLNNSASSEKHQIETMIAGVALLDYNNDGLLDIFLVNGASIPSLEKSEPKFYNRLFRNNGNGTFTDVTDAAGVKGLGFSMGVAAADFDNDGFKDLYVTGVNANQLLHNNGDGTFTDVTEKAGVGGIHPTLGKTWSVAAGWFDYNNDGKLDLLVTNYVRWDPNHEPKCEANHVRTYCAPGKYEGLPNFLYRNNGDGTFTDVSKESQIGALTGKGMGVAFADYDGDGRPDVFIANDSYRNFLLHNNGDGTFSEVGVQAGVAYNEDGKSIAGMGVDFRDIDNDGRPDLFVTGMFGDSFPLYRNSGRQFEDVTSELGVARATIRATAWGNGIVDLDNDGRKDLFACTGSILDNSWEVDRLPSKTTNLLLRNEGGTFRDESLSSGSSFAVPRQHRGAAFGDLNNDGREDIVTVSLGDRPEILIDESSPQNHWILLRLVGTKSNRDGLGAVVRISSAHGVQYNYATTSVGYASSSDPRVHFGLGSSTEVDEVEIKWPSGARQVLKNVRADQILTVREP